LSQSIVFLINDKPEETILIPVACPVPVRRSEHFNLGPEIGTCSAKIFLKKEQDGTKTQIAEVKLSHYLFILFY
jgi:hypothetical protein